jgi:hypothetical protein
VGPAVDDLDLDLLAVSGFVTVAALPSGSSGWAAIGSRWSNLAPLAVLLPWSSSP